MRATRVVLVGVLFMAVAAVLPTNAAGATPRPRYVPATAVPDSGIDESTSLYVDSAHDSVVAGGTERPPLSQRWSVALGDSGSTPLVTGGRVFDAAIPVGESTFSIYAFDAATGAPSWGPVDVGAQNEGLTAGDGLLYTINFNGVLQAFHQDTGLPAWTVQVPSQYEFDRAPTYRGGMVFVSGAGGGGDVYGFDALTGHLDWEQYVENGDGNSPSVTDTGVYVDYPCQDYDFVPTTGATVWHNAGGCDGGGGSTVAVGDGEVWTDYMSPEVLNASTGALISAWSGNSLPALNGSQAVLLDGSVLKSENASTFALQWSTGGDGDFDTSPIISDGYVWEGSSSGLLSAVDESTGDTTWSTNVGAPIGGTEYPQEASLAAGDGLIMVPTQDGHLVAYGPQTNAYTPLTPARILDTRSSAQIGWTGPEPTAGATVNMQVDGQGGVPSSDVSAVVLTLTGTDAEGAGYVTAWPTGTARPLASNLNLAGPGQTMANSVVVPVGAGGQVSLYTQTGADLIADVAGYFTPEATATAGRFVSLAPARLLDTRPPPTGLTPGGTPPAGGTVVPVAVLGHGGVPASGVEAVTVTVTAVDPTGPGFVTVWPSGSGRPLASNLNFDGPGQIVADAVTVPVGPDGKVDLFSNQTTDMVVDVTGWYTSASAASSASGLFVPTTPTRMVDTRADGPQVGYTGPTPVGHTVVDCLLAGRAPVPASGVSAITANVTLVNAEASGFLTVWPDGEAQPPTSSLYVDGSGEVLAGRVTVGLGAGGGVDVVSNVTTDFVVDVSGWFTS